MKNDMIIDKQIHLEHVNRLKNGCVVVRFLSIRDKIHVLAHAKNLKGKPYRVSEDFSHRVRDIRKGLTRLRNNYRNEGKKAVLRFDKLYTDFDVFTFDLRTRTVVKVEKQNQGPSACSSAHAQYLSLNLQRLRAQQERRKRRDSSSSGSITD